MRSSWVIYSTVKKQKQKNNQETLNEKIFSQIMSKHKEDRNYLKVNK